MKTHYSEQYKCMSIIPEGEDPEWIMQQCVELGAIFKEDEDTCFVLTLRPDVGPELWTHDAVKKSAKNGRLE